MTALYSLAAEYRAAAETHAGDRHQQNRTGAGAAVLQNRPAEQSGQRERTRSDADPADYMRKPPPPPPAPDKKLILQALKDGYSVPGCELKQTQRVVIK